jgi:hypothetical protein
MRGEDTSTQPHTGEHIASLALQVMEEIGLHRFSAVVTDGAANVTRARSLIVEKAPTVLNMWDPCHKLSLLIKDICTISELKPVRIHALLSNSIPELSHTTLAGYS